ncbi:MAG: peptidylprolyl isomerase [Tepidisphaerales bacterium]
MRLSRWWSRRANRSGGTSAGARPRRALSPKVESLEHRWLLSVVATQPLTDLTLASGAFPVSINLSQRFATTTISGTVVRLATSFGGTAANIDIELFDQATPVTVANFLNYVNSGRYDGTFFHRSVPGFVVQGGGYYFPSGSAVQKDAAIQNEFAGSPRDALNRVNTRGTVAMAKLGGNPNSATSEFFFNVADNSSNLDNQNGGFTTFGRVLGAGMSVVDQINALPRNGGFASPFDDMPLANFTPGSQLQQSNVVFVNSARVVSPLTFSVTSSDLTRVVPTLEGGTLRLTPQPNVTGSATITVTVNDLDGATLTSSFVVNVAPAATPAVFDGNTRLDPASPSAVNFGAIVPQNANPVTRSVVLENVGSEELTNLTYTLPAGYSFLGAPPGSLPSGERVNLTLIIDTASTGVKSGNLVISSPASSVPNFSVPLTADVRLQARLNAQTRTLIYTQGTGASATTVTWTFAGQGVADFVFSGNDLVLNDLGRGRLSVTGGETTLAGVTLAQTTLRTSLSVATRGPSLAVVPSVVGAGTAQVNRLDLRRARVTDAITFGSSAPTDAQVRNLLVGELDSAQVSIGNNNDPRAALAFQVGSAANSAIFVGYPVTTFAAQSWSGSGDVALISLRSVRTLNIRSNLAANVNITQALGTANVAGNLTGGRWQVGSAGRVTAGEGGPDYVLESVGRVNAVSFRNAFNGTVAVGSLGSFNAASGDGATVVASTTIDAVTFRTFLVGGFVQAGQVLNRFTAQSINETRIYAGFNDPNNVLPTAASQFGSVSRIGSVTLTARGNVYAFAFSAIAAREIGTLRFNAVRSVSNGLNGIAADTIRQVSFFTDANQRFALRNLNSQNQVPPIAGSQGTADFVLRLL